MIYLTLSPFVCLLFYSQYASPLRCGISYNLSIYEIRLLVSSPRAEQRAQLLFQNAMLLGQMLLYNVPGMGDGWLRTEDGGC